MIDNSDSEEEILIYAEFDENMKIGKYRSIHALGVDSKKPIVQLDDTFCTGKFVSPVGTYMFFEQDTNPQVADQLFEKIPENPLKYVCCTRKYLKMEHAYVTLKDSGEGMNLRNDNDCEDDVQIEVFNNLQEAIDKFKDSWSPTDDPELNSDVKKIVKTGEDSNTTTDEILS